VANELGRAAQRAEKLAVGKAQLRAKGVGTQLARLPFIDVQIVKPVKPRESLRAAATRPFPDWAMLA
jgi:hypothetical protein